MSTIRSIPARPPRRPLRPLRALIWDVDGTLAETEEAGHRLAFNEAFAHQGLPWHWDQATYRELLAVTGGQERLRAWWQRVDLMAATAPAAAVVIARLHQDKNQRYAARVAAGQVVLRPGVGRLLRAARAAGLLQAIATTTSPANVAALLTATLGDGPMNGAAGVDGSPGATPAGLFSVVGAGDSVARKKPAPDVYRWVLDRLGLQADECLAIEDSAPGVAAAQAAGLAVLVTRSHYSGGDPLPPVLADLDGLGEPGAPASGRAAGQTWQGVVDVAQLQRWWAERAPSSPIASGR